MALEVVLDCPDRTLVVRRSLRPIDVPACDQRVRHARLGVSGKPRRTVQPGHEHAVEQRIGHLDAGPAFRVRKLEVLSRIGHGRRFPDAVAACVLGQQRVTNRDSAGRVAENIRDHRKTALVRNHRPIRKIERPATEGAAGRSRVSGTGVGLAIARGLLAVQGGRIWAENSAEGGARFTMMVPAESRDALPPAAEPQ